METKQRDIVQSSLSLMATLLGIRLIPIKVEDQSITNITQNLEANNVGVVTFDDTLSWDEYSNQLDQSLTCNPNIIDRWIWSMDIAESILQDPWLADGQPLFVN